MMTCLRCGDELMMLRHTLVASTLWKQRSGYDLNGFPKIRRRMLNLHSREYMYDYVAQQSQKSISVQWRQITRRGHLIKALAGEEVDFCSLHKMECHFL